MQYIREGTKFILENIPEEAYGFSPIKKYNDCQFNTDQSFNGKIASVWNQIIFDDKYKTSYSF